MTQRVVDFMHCLQFFELDLPHASATKQQLVQKVLPDAKKVKPGFPVLLQLQGMFEAIEQFCHDQYSLPWLLWHCLRHLINAMQNCTARRQK